MALKVRDIDNVMEELAPKALKENYDNVGLMIGDREEEVTSILVALDCTLEVIEEAINKNCNFILTHHPILFLKPSNITTDSLQGKKIIKIIKNGLNVYASHTNLDSTDNGLNDLLMDLLEFKAVKILEPSSRSLELGKNAGIGRIATLENEISLSMLLEKVKKLLNIEKIRYAGDLNKYIRKVAVINGSGQDYFNKAKKAGADCVITGDTTYHYVSDIVEEGIAVIDAGHFETEWPVMKIVGAWLQSKLSSLGYPNKIYISEKVKSPYNVI